MLKQLFGGLLGGFFVGFTASIIKDLQYTEMKRFEHYTVKAKFDGKLVVELDGQIKVVDALRYMSDSGLRMVRVGDEVFLHEDMSGEFHILKVHPGVDPDEV